MPWTRVCRVHDISPSTGVCALVRGKQVALFRVMDRVFALDNRDPFSDANVLSRGIVGDRRGIPKVASPVYKQNFDLQTGVCLDDESIRVPSYDVRIDGDMVEVAVH